MADLVIIGIVLIIVGAAAAYVIRAKKRGGKCIGCPVSGQCPHKGQCGSRPEQPE